MSTIGLAAEDFVAAAEGTERNHPVGKALSGVPIELASALLG